MQSVFSFLVDQVIVWVIYGYFGLKVLDSAKEQKWGTVISLIALGSFCYYFVKNPETVLQWPSNNVIVRFFTGNWK